MTMQNIYNESLNALKEQVKYLSLFEDLEIKKISDEKLNNVITKIENIIGKPVFIESKFFMGKILGILRTIMINFKQRKELLEVTGLSQNHIDYYAIKCGNLPYPSNGVIVPERPMDVEATRQLIRIVGAHFDVLVKEEDLFDITQERWNNLVAVAYKSAEKTIEAEAMCNVIYEE